MANQDQSPLLRLPPELRNRIYHLFFKDHEVQLARYSDRPSLGCGHAAPGILLACHQTYDECIGIFYSASTFLAADKRDILAWLTLAPPKYMGLVRHIR
ncbi:hypothetical protein LTR85_009801 [Meristemomyces frigidus]|nr:hypothetical protein LTR85_009801 [Meristemomyces frigidus]